MPSSKRCDLTAFFLKKLLVNVSHRDKETNQERKAGFTEEPMAGGSTGQPRRTGPRDGREPGHGPQASPSRRKQLHLENVHKARPFCKEIYT